MHRKESKQTAGKVHVEKMVSDARIRLAFIWGKKTLRAYHKKKKKASEKFKEFNTTCQEGMELKLRMSSCVAFYKS